MLNYRKLANSASCFPNINVQAYHVKLFKANKIKNLITSLDGECRKLSLVNKKNNFLLQKNFQNIAKKNFYERKSLKWYWREKNYEMQDGDVYKNYLIKYKNDLQIELIPQNLPNGETYNSCLIWLYNGDFPEYFIEHLLEFNNFPPKVIYHLSSYHQNF